MRLRYRILLESQLGPREGELTLHAAQGAVSGNFHLLGFDNPVSGNYTAGQCYRLRHMLRTATRDLPCRTSFSLVGDGLQGVVETGSAKMKLQGHKLPGTPNRKGGDETP